MRVSDLMNAQVVSITPDASALTAARLLERHNIGSLPVCNQDGKISGIVTDRDIVLRCVASETDPNSTQVREIMSRNVITVGPDEDVREATRLMGTGQIRRLPVVTDGHIVGMVSLGDMAKSHTFDMEASHALSEISDNVQRV